MKFKSVEECNEAGIEIIKIFVSKYEVDIDISLVTQDALLSELGVDSLELLRKAEEILGWDLDPEKDALFRNSSSLTIREFQNIIVRRNFAINANAS